MSRFALRAALLVATAATVGCDRLTKHLASHALAGEPGRSFLGGAVQLEYAENPGAFLGLGAGWPASVRVTVFAAATVLGLLLIGRLAQQLRRGPALVGLGLIAGGSLSNLADRLANGSVVDFLYVAVGPVHTGVFNVADAAILAGAILVVTFGRRASAASAPA